MFEIGAVSMVLVGELLAIAIERGEVALDDPLGAYLPLGDAPAASVTLQSTRDALAAACPPSRRIPRGWPRRRQQSPPAATPYTSIAR